MAGAVEGVGVGRAWVAEGAEEERGHCSVVGDFGRRLFGFGEAGGLDGG